MTLLPKATSQIVFNFLEPERHKNKNQIYNWIDTCIYSCSCLESSVQTVKKSAVYPFLPVPLTHTNISHPSTKNKILRTTRGSNLDSRSRSLSLCSLWLFSSLTSREDLKEAASSASLDVGRYNRLFSSLGEVSSVNNSADSV